MTITRPFCETDDIADLKRDRPVRIAITYKRRDEKPARELRVDLHLADCVQVTGEFAFDVRIRDDKVVDVVLQLPVGLALKHEAVVADRCAADRITRIARDPHLGRQVAQVIVLDPGRAFDLGRAPFAGGHPAQAHRCEPARRHAQASLRRSAKPDRSAAARTSWRAPPSDPVRPRPSRRPATERTRPLRPGDPLQTGPPSEPGSCSASSGRCFDSHSCLGIARTRRSSIWTTQSDADDLSRRTLGSDCNLDQRIGRNL